MNSISLKNGFISSIIFTLKSYFEDNSVSLSFIFFAWISFIVLKSKHAFADAGIEFLALPPSNIPMFIVVYGISK